MLYTHNLLYGHSNPTPVLHPLQAAYRGNRSVDDTFNIGLHFNLKPLDTTAITPFGAFSSTFNTIPPNSHPGQTSKRSPPLITHDSPVKHSNSWAQ